MEDKKGGISYHTLSVFFYVVGWLVGCGGDWIYLSPVGVVLDVEGGALLTVGQDDLVPEAVGGGAIERE